MKTFLSGLTVSVIAFAMFAGVFWVFVKQQEHLEKSAFILGCTSRGSDRIVCADAYRRWVDSGRP